MEKESKGFSESVLSLFSAHRHGEMAYAASACTGSIAHTLVHLGQESSRDEQSRPLSCDAWALTPTLLACCSSVQSGGASFHRRYSIGGTLHIVVQNGGNSSLCVILYLTLHLPGPIKTKDGEISGRTNQW